MSENRDRGKRIELKGTVEEAVATLNHFLNTEMSGMIGFRKNESNHVELWASSEQEPTT